jgi:hypothetical protein
MIFGALDSGLVSRRSADAHTSRAICRSAAIHHGLRVRPWSGDGNVVKRPPAVGHIYIKSAWYLLLKVLGKGPGQTDKRQTFCLPLCWCLCACL